MTHDIRCIDFINQGFCPPCADLMAFSVTQLHDMARITVKPRLCTACDQLTSPALSGLLKMAYMFSDWYIQKNLDTLIAEALTSADVKVLRKYARSRRNGRGFSPGKANASNHTRALVIQLQPSKKCKHCQKPFSGRASYCSDACSAMARRKRLQTNRTAEISDQAL